MTDECISPLRRRMIEDMTVRNFVVKPITFGGSRALPFFLGARPILRAGKMSDATCCIWHRAEWARPSTALARRCGFCST